MLDGQAVITPDHPIFADPMWNQGIGTGVLTLYPM